MRASLYVDIDNTLLDVLSKIKRDFDDTYEPTKQVCYDFENKELLKLFSKSEFYENVIFNTDVLDLIKTLDSDYQLTVHFLSYAMNQETILKKREVVTHLLLNNLHRYHFTGTSHLITLHKTNHHIFEQIQKDLNNHKKVFVVDDAVSRLRDYVDSNLPITIFPVEHLYNKEYRTSEKSLNLSRNIKPNYLK